MKMKIYFIIIVSLGMLECKTTSDNKAFQIGKIDLKIKDIEIISTKMFDGFLLGTDFDRNELYVNLSLYSGDFYSIGIIDLETGNIKRSIKQRKGDLQSPTDLYNPTYMQCVGDKYYLIDWFHKVLVFDQNLNYLYTTISQVPRYFIDFYKINEDHFFMIGKRRFEPKKCICSVEIYQIVERSKPILRKKIYETSHNALYYTWDSNRPLYGILWASNWGFEKDDKIYFGNNNKRNYFVYDIENKKVETIELDYLEGKKYSDEDAINLCMLKCDFADFHDERTTFIAHPDNLYYFGFYDVGKNKIGIVGDLDIQKMNFRLDIFTADSRKYLKSIWLPIGHGFLRRLFFNSRGLFLTRIDVDRGFYVWLDQKGEYLDFVAKLTRFKINGTE